MEFLELLLLFCAVLIIWLKPAWEKLAYALVVVPWLVVWFMYLGHTSSAVLGNWNL